MSLDTLFADFNKKYKDEIAMKGVTDKKCARIPFSSPRANYMLYGGLPRKRVIEFFGDYSCGKTTTALDIISQAQKLFKKEAEESGQPEKKCVFVDVEHTLDADWSTTLGVNLDDLYYLDPLTQTAEQIFQMVLEMIETGEVGLVVIDSLAAMVSQQAMEKTMEEKTMAGISAALTTFSNKVCGLLSKYDCTLIGINQVRMDLKNQYNLYTTPGGKGWQLACSVRLFFQQGALLDEGGEEIKVAGQKSTPHGNQIQMTIKKTKVCRPNRKLGFYSLMYAQGIDKYCDTFDLGCMVGAITGSGWYYFTDPETGERITDDAGELFKIQGRKNVIAYFKENDWLYQAIEQQLNDYIEGI